MKKLLVVCVLLSLLSTFASAQELYPFRALDPNPYDPAVDPDIDMFIGHWHNSMPRIMYGTMVFRDVLTELQGDDPLRPTKKCAVLVYQHAVSHATLDPGGKAVGSPPEGQQQVFYVTDGEGTIASGGKTHELKAGMGFITTPRFEVEIRCTSDTDLTFYVLTEKLPADFSANESLVVTNRFNNRKGTGAHWAHIGNSIIGKKEGMANFSGMGLITMDARTIPHPHSHAEGIEEVWIMVKGTTMLQLGKQLRDCPAGTIYKVPANGMTPHTNINLSDEPVQMIHMMKAIPGETKPFAMLDPNKFDPEVDPDVDMFMGDWRDSLPRIMHRHMVFRDILTALEGPDDLHPTRKGACLQFAEAISYATLEPGATASPVEGELEGIQQICVVNSGEGVITSNGESHRLFRDMVFILTPGLDFELKPVGDDLLTFYITSEYLEDDFEYNKKLVVEDNRYAPTNVNYHWVNIGRAQLTGRAGTCHYTGISHVTLDAMTIPQAHSHLPGVEEVWIALEGDIELLIGKQLRKLPVGTAYRVPSTGKCAHTNINASSKKARLTHQMTSYAHNPGVGWK